MSRIPLADPASMTAWQKAQYDRFPSNLSRALVLLDERTAGALPAMANALRTTTLEPAWREAVILRVATLLHSDYERFQHLQQAAKESLTAAEIDDISDPGSTFGAVRRPLPVVLRFADALTAGVDVQDHLLAAARAVLGDQHVMTVIVLVGHYSTVARITSVLGVPLDDEPDPWTGEH